MAAAPLTSNHVNYLIWRYLQESGHDKSALRLQRDWKIGDPEDLPFARHIQTHALVSLVQKGLQYHELESSLQQNGDRATQTPTTLYFGTDSAEAVPSRISNEASSSLRAPSSPRKHARDSISAGSAFDAPSMAPASKRQRRPPRDGANAAAAKSGDEMDLDQQQDTSDGLDNANNIEPGSEHRGAQLPNGKLEHQDPGSGQFSSDALTGAAPAAPTPSPPPVPTLDSGASVPTQTDSVIEVSKDITQLLETHPSKEALLTAWNPHQSNMLISGGDSLCRLFRFGNASATDAPATNGTTVPSGSAPKIQDLFETMDGASITALAWSPDGQQVAVARHLSESETASWISLFDTAGALEGELSQSQQFFFGLAYSPGGAYLLGFGGVNAHYEDDSRDFCCCIWDTSNPQETEPLTLRTAARQEITAATWIDEETIIACGPGFVAQSKLADGKLQDWQSILPNLVRGPEQRPHEWSMIATDKYSGTCIISAAEQGLVATLSQDKESLIIREAHSKLITGLQYQPLPQHGSTGEGPRIVASASEDGTIKLWDAADKLSLIKVLQCDSLRTDAYPVLAMQFDPSGSSLAAASFSRVVFWRAESTGAWPNAIWELTAGMGWRSLSSEGPEAEAYGETELRANGLTNGVNGTNGHSRSNGASETAVNEGVQADRMSIDGETAPVGPRNEDEESPATTLLWSAMGKKIAFGSRNQIAVADFTKAQMI